jgi:hypothetical protein
MGLWSFHKRFRLFPGVAVNVSKSGLSLSLGGQGLTTSISQRGVKTTTSLPGTGLRYQQTWGKPAAGVPRNLSPHEQRKLLKRLSAEEWPDIQNGLPGRQR